MSKTSRVMLSLVSCLAVGITLSGRGWCANTDQLKGLLTGKIGNWNEAGGPDKPAKQIEYIAVTPEGPEISFLLTMITKGEPSGNIGKVVDFYTGPGKK